MEILSTGEKIKRARIYKGITLKDLCEDKISISKMSCIENGKIKADDESLEYIANKLNVEFEYLTQDVYEQITENINSIKDMLIPSNEIEKTINYNLEYAIEYSFNELAFQLTHILFLYYLEENKIENIQLLISKYYDLYQNCTDSNDIITYYNDMATFFVKIYEYHEAINYYDRIKEIIEKENIDNKTQFVYACYYQGVCYKNIKEIEKAYNSLKQVLKFTSYFRSNKDKGEFYHEFAILNILLHKVETEKYLEKSFNYQKDNLVAFAKSKGENGKYYFEVNENKKALNEIQEGIEIFPRENKVEYSKFLVSCIQTLYNNNELQKAFNLTDEALNLSIDLGEDKLVEMAYYYKGMIYQRQGQYLQAEMYMNLSTDFLLREASKEQKYKRYNEMAELYYNLKEYKEAIKYFTLAMNMEKKL